MPVSRQMELEIEGKTFRVQVVRLTAEKATVRVNGRAIEVNIRPSAATPINRPAPEPQAPAPHPAFSRAVPQGTSATSNELCAMMPGVVTRVLVKPGQEVSAGDVLLVLEAMKMENEIRSDRGGTIERVHVTSGEKVQTGEVMISFAQS